MQQRLRERGFALPPSPAAGHSPDQERPLRGYGVLLGTFISLASAFAAWFRRSGRELPETIAPGDLALLTVASHKAARGGGLRRAVGELLVCPYCLGMWVSASLTASLLVFPRFTRWVCVVFVSFFGSELLQVAYVRAQARLAAPPPSG